MKPPETYGARKKHSFFSFGGARAPSNTNPNSNTPGSRPQNSEQAIPVSPTTGTGTILRGSETDDEWYIPYKGPYQLPASPSSPGHFQGHHQRANSTSSSNVLPGRSRAPGPASSSLRRSRSRDSWGDPIYPIHDLPLAEGPGYDDRAMFGIGGAELNISGRNQAARGGDRDKDSDRANKEGEEDKDWERVRTRRSGSLTVTISKSRLSGFSAILGDGGIVNERAGSNTDKGEAGGIGKRNKEVEDKDPNSQHRHHHRPMLISQSPTLLAGSIGSVSSPSPTPGTTYDATNTHRRRPSTAPSPSSPTRFRFSTRAVPIESVSGTLSHSPSPSPSAAPVPAQTSHIPAPPSPTQSRSRTETGTSLLSFGLGVGGLDTKGNRRRSTVSSGTGTGIFARSPSPTSASGFASGSSPSFSPQTRHRAVTPSYISLDPTTMGGVGESPVPVASGGTSGLAVDGDSRSRPRSRSATRRLSSLLAPTHKLLKRLSKLGLGSSAKEEKKKEEKEREEKEKEREKAKQAETVLRSHQAQPRARSQPRPVLRIHPPDHGDDVGNDENLVSRNRLYRQGQRTESMVSGEQQPHFGKSHESDYTPPGHGGDQVALPLNTRMHSRNRSKSSPLPPTPSQVHSQLSTRSQTQPHAKTHNAHSDTHAHDSPHAHGQQQSHGHSPEPELEYSPHSHTRTGVHSHNQPQPHPHPHSHSYNSNHPHPHLHLNLNPTRSYSHSLSTYASTSTAIATATSLGTNSKPSPSSSAGGAPSQTKPGTGLEIEEMVRVPGDDRDGYDEEDEEEDYRYRYGSRGGAGAAYGLQPSSATSSVEGGQQPDRVGRGPKKKHPYAYSQTFPGAGGGDGVEDITAFRQQHPYARDYSPASLSQQHGSSAVGSDNNGVAAFGLGAGTGMNLGVGIKKNKKKTKPGMTTRQDQVERLSPIPSGPSLPSVSVLSVVGAGGTGTGAASRASLVGPAAGGGSDAWDVGSGMGERALFRNSMSTPDLRFTGVGAGAMGADVKQRAEDGGSAIMKMRVWSMLGLREKERKEKEKEKERRWLSTQSPYSILLPRPRFRVRTLERGERPAVAAQGGDTGAGTVLGLRESGKQGLQNRSRSLMNLVAGGGGGGEGEAPKVASSLPEFGGQREQGKAVPVAKNNEESQRRSYVSDDVSLLSLDKVLEERDKLENDRKKWQAQAAKSLGNKQSRAVSRSRAKSLTLAGRKMINHQARGHPAQPHPHQSHIDYLAARACLGNQDFSPLMEYSEGGLWLARQLKEKEDKAEKHERKPSASASSDVATTTVGGHSGGHRSTAHGHQRNDSWSRSAVRLARSLPQICGIMPDSTEKLKSGENKQRLEDALKREDTKVIKLSDPAAPVSGGDQWVRDTSPVSLAASDGAVGLAISTPPVPDTHETSYVLPDHPYALGADRQDDGAAADIMSQADNLPIRIPAHPYAQGGLSMGSNPEYAGRHPTSSPAHLMASLGLSEVSARHRLPPQITIGQQQPTRGTDDQQNQEQDRLHSRPLYVRVDSRNSYQDLWPYVRADSNIAPPEKLWVTYSPGVVREVLPSEVFQYSPREQENLLAPPVEPRREDSSRRDHPDDTFLKKYKRMSMVYQDTASMSEALYDAFDQRASTVAEPRYSALSGSGVDDGEMQVDDADHAQGDSMEPELKPEHEFSQEVMSQERYDYREHRPRTPEPGRVPGPSSSKKGLVDSSPIEYHPFDTAPTNRFANTSKETSTYSSPVTPSVPRINSPNNLEPFHDLFYKPPCDSETDSLSSPPVEDEAAPLENVPWDVGSSSSQRTGLTSLVRQLGDDLEQMALDHLRSSSQYSQDSDAPEIPPRTSSLARLGMQSGHINSEVGPFHFLFQNSPQQEPRRTHNMAHPSRFSPFDPANTIPEDVELSENPSSDERAEDDTVRYPVVTIDPASTPQFNHPSRRQSLFGPGMNDSEEHLPAEPLASSRGLTLDGLRSSHLTSSTLSRMSGLSEFPSPPETITHEQMSVLSSYHDDNTIT